MSAATARTSETGAETRRGDSVIGIDKTKRFYARRPAILYGGQLDDTVKAVVGETYDFFKVKRVAEDHLLLRDAAGTDRRLNESPLQLAALIGFDRGDSDLVTRAADWLKRRQPETTPEPQWIAPGDGAALAAHLLGNAQKLLKRQAEMSAGLARQLAATRQSNEDLQNRFAALETFIDRHGLQPFERAFVNEPAQEIPGGDAVAANVLAMAARGRVTQILPVASLGVSAIALHVAKPAPRSDAVLTISLSAIETGETVETWSVPAAELPAGWTTLTLRSAIAGLRRTLRLAISVEGARSDLPVLSLGGAQPLELFRLRDQDLDQSVSAASLALQVFVGLPGVVPPTPGGFSAKAAPSGGMREQSLAQEVLGNTEQVKLDPDAGGFDGVTYLEGERIISCHPPAFGMTIAKVLGGAPANALRLSANLLVDHAQSREVEFALVVSGDEARVLHLLSGITEPVAGEGFSGWTRVPAKQPRFASVYLDGNTGKPADFYLATRMVEPGNHDFAWARFLNLHALLQG